MTESPHEVLRRKLKHLQTEEAKAVDAEQKFNLKEKSRILFPPDPIGGGPWIELAVSPFHIVKAALDLNRPPIDIVKRLRQLGFTLPGTQPDWDAIGSLGDSDRILISRDLDGKGNWIGPELPPARILAAAVKLNRTPGSIAARTLELGFTLAGGPLLYDEITGSDLPLISSNLDGAGHWLGPDIPLGHILKAAGRLGQSPEAIVSRLSAIGFAIQPGAWPHELEIIVAIWHGCSRQEASQRLREAGWTASVYDESAAESSAG